MARFLCDYIAMGRIKGAKFITPAQYERRASKPKPHHTKVARYMRWWQAVVYMGRDTHCKVGEIAK